MSASLLSVRHLTTSFTTGRGVVDAVRDISFDIEEREIVGVVGESGCGKSVTALSIMRLLRGPRVRMGGEVFFRGRDLLALDDEQMRELRGRDIAMIFQDLIGSLNPSMRVGRQIEEAIKAHARASTSVARQQAIDLLNSVRIPDAHERARAYPHQLSGGMSQRVMIAMALANDPALLIADEPTTALDVTVQAEILELIRAINRTHGSAVLFITHNLAVVARVCQRVVVMYAGQIVESGRTTEIFRAPQHPYTALLLRSAPRTDRPVRRLASIDGAPPDPAVLPPGCPFHPRCPVRLGRCAFDAPFLEPTPQGGSVRCWIPGTIGSVES